jgi:electron transfer flavoprotein beta subunit
MRVLVPVKRVVDPYVNIHVKKDESDVDIATAKRSMNPFDEIAMEQAAQWQEAGITTEIVAVSIGPPAVTETLRAALARGADRAIHVEAPEGGEPLLIAKVLKHIVNKEKSDVVIMGKQAIDDDCNQTGQMLAALLGWPQATFASTITLADNTATVKREVDGGEQTVELTLPAVFTCDLRLNDPRHISLPNIMKAKTKPLDLVALSDMELSPDPRLITLSVKEPPARSPGIRVMDVDSLLDYLRHKEKILP